MWRCVLRSCGVLGADVNDHEHRLVVCLGCESMEDSEVGLDRGREAFESA